MKKAFILLVFACFMVFTISADVSARAAGYGVFQKMHYINRLVNPSRNVESPYIAGAEFIFSWAELEPQKGDLRWEIIDAAIAPWVAQRKKVILTFQTMQDSFYQDGATPAWVYDLGAKNFTIGDVNYPVFWDPVYLKNYQNFVGNIARRYNNNPNIEFITMGVGIGGTTKIAGNNALLDIYKSYGYTEQLWVETILDIIDIYRNQFRRLPVTLTISPFYNFRGEQMGDGSEYLIRPIVEYAMKRGVYIYNHSLTGTTDFANNPFVTWYEPLSLQYLRSKIILGTDNPTVNTDQYGTIEDIIANSFGDLTIGTTYVPPTHMSYFIIYPQDISAATQGDPTYVPRYDVAMKNLVNGLKP